MRQYFCWLFGHRVPGNEDIASMRRGRCRYCGHEDYPIAPEDAHWYDE